METKYQPLADYLGSLPATSGEATLTFHHLERILGFRLPRSATDYRQWWENPSAPGGRSQAEAWSQAGFAVDSVHLSRDNGWVCFRRV